MKIQDELTILVLKDVYPNISFSVGDDVNKKELKTEADLKIKFDELLFYARNEETHFLVDYTDTGIVIGIGLFLNTYPDAEIIAILSRTFSGKGTVHNFLLCESPEQYDLLLTVFDIEYKKIYDQLTKGE